MRELWEKNIDGSLITKESYALLTDKEKEEGFIDTLSFGTAGIRGKIGLGPNRLNKYTVQKVAAGIGQFLHDKTDTPRIVIGFDTRHFSLEFMQIIAEVLSATGIKVIVTPDYTSTPELSYFVRTYKSDLGIMITASHNPPEYNGIKVYGEDGSQLIDEPSEALSKYINAIEDVFSIESKDFETAVKDGDVKYVSNEVKQAYRKEVTDFVGEIPKSDLSIVFSSLHGTSVPIVPELLEALNFNQYSLVESQCVPDGDFPTTPSPNPESPEAFTLSVELGKEIGADVLIATDPDADRMGIVVKHEDSYEHLTGNQIGILLLNRAVKGIAADKTPVAIKSIVTSDLGKKIIEGAGGEMIEVLTGFKYIGEQLLAMEDDADRQFVLGYEESYGYLLRPFVRDKDAIQVVPYVVKYASELKNEGRTLIDELNDIYKKFGHRQEHLWSHTFEGSEGRAKIDKIMRDFREQTPLTIDGRDVVAIEDYLEQSRFDVETGEHVDIDLPAANVIKLHFKDGWIALRPSGTEAKIKLYISIDTDDLMTEAQIINDLVFGE